MNPCYGCCSVAMERLAGYSMVVAVVVVVVWQ